jgi:hypothetical protein
LSSARRWVLAHALTLQLGAYIIRPSSAYQAWSWASAPALSGSSPRASRSSPSFWRYPSAGGTTPGTPFQNLLPGALLMVVGGIGLLWWSSSLTALLLWNAVIGMGHLMSVLGEQTLVARSGSSALDSAFGTYTLAGSLGQAAGPLVAHLDQQRRL